MRVATLPCGTPKAAWARTRKPETMKSCRRLPRSERLKALNCPPNRSYAKLCIAVRTPNDAYPVISTSCGTLPFLAVFCLVNLVALVSGNKIWAFPDALVVLDEEDTF